MNSVKPRILFRTLVDEFGSTQRKIVYDDVSFSDLIRQMSANCVSVEVIGFVGNNYKCISDMCCKFLKLDTKQVYDLELCMGEDKMKINQVDDCDECIIAVNVSNRMALIYWHSEPIFRTGPLSLSTLAIDYVRYIMDMCQNIVLIPPVDIQCEPCLTNPFEESIISGFDLQQTRIEAGQDIKLHQLSNSTSNNHPLSYSECTTCIPNRCKKIPKTSKDHVPILYTVHFFEKEIGHNSPCKPCYPHDSQTGKPYYCRALNAEVRLQWPTNHELFCDIKNHALDAFKSTIRPDQLAIFENEMENIQNDYNQSAENTKKRKLIEFADHIFKLSENYSCQTEHTRGFFKAILSAAQLSASIDSHILCHESCTKKCLTLREILHTLSSNRPDKKEDLERLSHVLEQYAKYCLGFKIYKKLIGTCESSILKTWKNLLAEEKTIGELHEKRVFLVNRMLSWLEGNDTTAASGNLHSWLRLEFYDIVPFFDSEKKAGSFQVKKKANEISCRLGKSSQTTQTSIQQLLFISRKTGYFILWDSSEKRAALKYFDFGNLSKHTVIDMCNLRSISTRLIIDQRTKMYCIYDNEHRTAEQGKYDDVSGKLLASTPINSLYNDLIQPSQKRITSIISMCFLQRSNSFLVINEEHQLVQCRYKAGLTYILLNSVLKDPERIEKSEAIQEKYERVGVTPEGTTILLQSRTLIDLYDLNWSKLKIIYIPDSAHIVGFKTFFGDKADTYIILQHNDHKYSNLLIEGLAASQNFDIKYEANDCVKGFPLLDVFYAASRKYGVQSRMIKCPKKTQLAFVLDRKYFALSEAQLTDYFDQLALQNFELCIRSLDECDWDSFFEKVPQVDLHQLENIMLSRVPIHVATIEDNNIYPLQYGNSIKENISNWASEESEKKPLVNFISELIKIGPYEHILQQCEKSVKVVAIIGAQSGGKSYLLNRLTGTRFNVAATRCTDGIWISFAILDEQPIVVLDCEGLLSTQRNDLEDAKLCLVLSAVTDALIFNQDLKFDRNIDKLFESLAKSCGHLRGQNLFKGILMIVIRNMEGPAVSQVYQQIIASFKQRSRTDQSINMLFGGKMHVSGLHDFKSEKIFENELQVMRRKILQLESRWKSGTDFLDTLKLVLAQVHTDDDAVIDLLQLKIIFARLDNEACRMFADGGEKSNPWPSLRVEMLKLSKNDNAESTILIKQEELKLLDQIQKYGYHDNQDDHFIAESAKLTRQLFCKLIEDHFNRPYNDLYHDSWYRNVDLLLEKTLEHRVKLIMSYVSDRLPENSDYDSEIQNYLLSMKTKLNRWRNSARTCMNQCDNQCQRICIKFKSHAGNCDCGTDHYCKGDCELCSNVNACSLRHGHKDQHRCSNGHTCNEPCQFFDSCRMRCILDISDHGNQKHRCTGPHLCGKKCSQDGICQKTCVIDLENEHSEHRCRDENVCPHKCSMPGCRNPCAFPNHVHEKLIHAGDKAALSTNFGQSGVSPSKYDYHICDEKHSCSYDCDQDGVCCSDYNIVEKVWPNPTRTFQYYYYEPKCIKSKCNIAIPKYERTHISEVKHNCKIPEHQCNEKCPECQSYCQLSFNHPNPFHSTKNHRNKESNIFVSKKSESGTVKVKHINGPGREYNLGESCEPEICAYSCERKGRAHYHLKLCPGDESCPSKQFPYVKHSNDSWFPHKELKYDMWLCEAFWNSLDWKVPYGNDVLDNVKSCSYYCARHDEKHDKFFCKKTAWHTDNHEFLCEHRKVTSLDVVFCCDTTGSMQTYISETKNMIDRIMECAKVVEGVKFRFVVYRDHYYQEWKKYLFLADKSYDQYVVSSNPENLSDAPYVKKFIGNVTVGGGGDIPEAVHDGLYDAITATKWREDSETIRYLIHIADAPPHGRVYGTVWKDDYPEGCPCQITVDKISAELNHRTIRYKLLMIGNTLNMMASVFREKFNQYEERQLSDVSSLTKEFMDILYRDLEFEEIDVNSSR